MPNKYVTYKGVRISFQDVTAAMRVFDADRRNGFRQNRWKRWAIKFRDQIYPPKEVLRIAARVSVEGGGSSINDLYTRLGFEVVEIAPATYQYRGSFKGHSAQSNPLDDLEAHKTEYEDATEKESIIKARIGQGKFRENLIRLWGRCAVTGCQENGILRASHIKPWRLCDNEQRLDRYNGLLLIPNLDALFDAGIISFDDIGMILISEELSASDRVLLGLNQSMKLEKIHPDNLKYLQYHRELHGYNP